MNRAPNRISALVSVLFLGASLFGTAAFADPLTPEQAKCAAKLAKDATKTSAALTKLVCACAKDDAKGSLATTIDACVDADDKGKVAKAAAKTAKDFDKSCSGVDGSGTARLAAFGATTASLSSAKTSVEARAVFADLLGSPLDVGFVDAVAAPGVNACQRAVSKSMKKCLSTRLKAFVDCSSAAIEAGATSSVAIEDACLGVGASGQPDPKGKIAKACDLAGDKTDKIRSTLAKKCDAVDLATAFPACASAEVEATHACVAAAAACRACRTANGTAMLDRNCDLADNGANDGSCPHCGNDVADAGEDCDGTDDDACDGACTSYCVCPGPRSLTIAEPASGLLVRGLGPDLNIDLGGGLDIEVTGEAAPGAITFDIGEQQLAPAVGELAGATVTICVFFEQSPDLAVGVSGTGVVNCSASDLSGTGLFAGPVLTEYLDHCVEGAPAVCDSAPNDGGGRIDGLTGLFVPDGLVDVGCDDAGSAIDAVAGHEGACNPVPVEEVGAEPYGRGDATFHAFATFDVRSGVDSCDPPVTPGSQSARIEFTTGRATTGIMDRNATARATLATDAVGVPFDCPSFWLAGDGAGATFVGAFPVIDLDLGLLIRDVVIAAAIEVE